MNVDVLWSGPARDDLVEIWTYLAHEASEPVADRTVLEIVAAGESLALNPLRGRTRDEVRPGLRSILSPPYLVFYRVRETAVEIVRVLHGRRDIGRLLGGAKG